MANLNIRIDDDLKKQASDLFKELGMNMTTAVTMFLQQAVTDKGLPFIIRKSDEDLTEIKKWKRRWDNPTPLTDINTDLMWLRN